MNKEKEDSEIGFRLFLLIMIMTIIISFFGYIKHKDTLSNIDINNKFTYCQESATKLFGINEDKFKLCIDYLKY